jgi:hypothetical protein
MFSDLPDPDPLVKGVDPAQAPDPSIILSFYHQAKIVRKTLFLHVFRLFLEILSLKNDVNVPLKSNKQKYFLY